jgi:hypothetical protein
MGYQRLTAHIFLIATVGESRIGEVRRTDAMKILGRKVIADDNLEFSIRLSLDAE